jgi:tetratricopeptide (TPR) repeat protein
MFRYTFELSIVDRSVEDKWAVLTAARAIGDGVLISIALVNLSMLSLTAHDFRMAQQLAEEALATVRRLNFTWGLASVLYALTRIKELQGDVTAAHAYNLERYAVERQLDNPHGYTDTLQDTIRLAIWQADYQQAADLSAQVEGAALTTWKIFGVFAAWISAWLAVEQGHHNAARILAQEAHALCDLSVTQHFQTRSFMISGTLATGWLLGTITAGQGRHDQAIAAYEATLGIVQALTPAEQLTNSQALQSLTFAFSGPAIVALSGLGRIAAYHPHQSFARTWLNQTLAVIRTTIDIWEPTIARAVWGRAYLGWGEYTAAAAQFSDDLRFYHKAGARRAIAEALEGLAACAGAKGQWEFAVRWWAAADQLRTAIGAPLWPVDQADREQRMAQARTQLSPGAFEAAWVAGQALSLDHAVAEALAFTDLPAS